MLGHYVDGLSREAEDRVLTSRLGATKYYVQADCRCLVGAAADTQLLADGSRSKFAEPEQMRRSQLRLGDQDVGIRYDDLHKRFGERLNIAIRNRILANRARRLLAVPAREEVTV